jgi:hypothetical protein
VEHLFLIQQVKGELKRIYINALYLLSLALTLSIHNKL